jgi:hypothetical protein
LLKEHPRLVLAGIGLLLLVAVVFAIKGCGGSNTSSPESDAVAFHFPTPPGSAAPQKTPKVETQVQAKTQPQVQLPPPGLVALAAGGARAVTVQQEVSNSRRPKDVADWRCDDYDSAKKDNDPRLVAAVAYLGRHFAGKESAANFLAKLLEPPDAAAVATSAAAPPADDPARAALIALAAGRPRGGSGTPVSGPGASALTEAILAALVANGTPRARQILGGIADGSLKTADKQAGIAALHALAAHPGPETEDLLFRIVTAREDTAVDASTSQLRSTALESIRTGSFEVLSVRLAKWMLANEPSKALHDQLWACLKEPRPENLAAQIMLYQGSHLDKTMHDWLEQWIVACSSDVLGRLMGIPAPQADLARSAPASVAEIGWPDGAFTPQRPETALAKTVTAANPYRLAESLWSANLAEVIAERLRALETLDKDAALIALAGTTPGPTLRAALLRTLERHWEEGPKGLQSLRAAAGVNVEPGFVALLKMLPRNDPVETVDNNDKSKRNGNLHRSSTQAKKGVADAQKDRQRQQQVGQEWMDFSRDMTREVCQRLYSAALAKQSGRGGIDRTADHADLPFKLPPRAEVAAAYHLDWPDDLKGKLSAAPMLRIRYVRIEQKAAPASVLAFFRRQVPTGKEHPRAGGDWLDSVVVEKEHVRARSVDVLMASVGKSVIVGLPNQEQELTVDILTIECEGIAKPCALSASR